MKARHLSNNTVQARLVALRTLARFMGGPILYATADDLQKWQAHVAARVSTSTLRGYCGQVAEFYAWCIEDQLIVVNPAARMRRPSAPKYLPRPLSDDEFREALACDHADVRAMVALAGYAGLRAAEIAALDWPDVDLKARTLRLFGKGRRERIVPISDPLRGVLLEHRERAGTDRGPVIRRRDGNAGRVAPHRISHIANRWLHECGSSSTLHSLRHRFATQLLDASGGDLRLVQDALGHESPATTSVYARVRPARMAAAVQAAASVMLDEQLDEHAEDQPA